MSKKEPGLFQVIHEMTENDTNNQTKFVRTWLSPTSIEDLRKNKKVTFTIPVDAFLNKDIVSTKKRLLLVLIDADEFVKVDKKLQGT